MNSKLTKQLTGFFLVFGIALFFLKVFNKRVDFPCFYLAGSRYGEATNLYIISDEWPYKYLPSAAFFFRPLSFLPYHFSLISFYIGSFLSMVLTYFLIIKNLEKEKMFFGFLSIALLFLINLKAHAYDFANLQINHFMVFALVLSFYLKQTKPKTKWQLLSAFLFAAAGIFKIIPLLISFYYLLKKEFKYFFMILFFTLVILVLPILNYGIEGLLTQYKNYELLMKNYHQLFSTDRLYQSIPSFIARLFESLGLQNEMMMKVLLLIMIIPWALLVLKMILDQTKIQRASLKCEWLQFSSCLIFYPLVNPVSWKHGYVFVMPAIFYVGHAIWNLKLYQKWNFKFLIGLYLFLSFFTSEVFIGKKLSQYKDLLSFNVFAAMIILILVYLTHSKIIEQEIS
jgi:hypothetical protein